MQRRRFIQLAQTGLLFSAAATVSKLWDGSAIAQPKPPKTPSNAAGKSPAIANLTIQWLGHMSFLCSGGGARILTHPYKSAGCTAGLTMPKVNADLVLISSRLLDEGYVANLPSDLKVLFDPGAYNIAGIGFQGIRMAHDRIEGRRFGTNVAWLWQQSGVRILHLGGAAASLLPEQRILMGRPNVLMLPIGGGDKGYNAEEAKAVVDSLNPQVVIPTHFRTKKSNSACDLANYDGFIELMKDRQINRINGSSLQLTSLPQSQTVMVFN